MSLLPRRLRAGQAGNVAVHPGWTLSPPTAQPGGVDPVEYVHAAELPASRWTSAPSLPAVLAPTALGPTVMGPTVMGPTAPTAPTEPATPAAAARPVPAPVPAAVVVPAPEVLSFWVEPPAASIATVLSAPLPSPEAVEAAVPSWTQEWESVAATPTTPAGATALHTAVVAALDAAFGAPAPVAVPPVAAVPLEPTPVAGTPSVLDLPLRAGAVPAETPLAAQTSAFLQGAAPETAAPQWVTPVPVPPRTLAVPAPAQQIVDRAVRSAPSAPVQRRSTVRLGFTDASVVDLRPDDPMAKALHTVADALIGRDRLATKLPL